MKKLTALLVLVAVLAGPAHATPVSVEIKGTVEFNQIRQGVLARTIVPAGSPVSITFLLDSDNFVNSGTFPVRGYVINNPSFKFMAGTAMTELQNPFPAGQVPYFVLRNNDPAVDGFYLSTLVDGPIGVPLNAPAQIDPYFISQFSVGYLGTTLTSLNIEDALGTFNYTGLTNFNFVLNDAGFDAMGIEFIRMDIAAVVVPVEPTSWGRIKTLFN